jgi:hypothetical protein
LIKIILKHGGSKKLILEHPRDLGAVPKQNDPHPRRLHTKKYLISLTLKADAIGGTPNKLAGSHKKKR